MNSPSIIMVDQKGVACATGTVQLPQPDGITFGASHGRVLVAITHEGVSTYAVLQGDAIDAAAGDMADACTRALRQDYPSLERRQ